MPFPCMGPEPAHAGPASPDPVYITQPGGKKFKAYIRGDEFQGWTETAAGLTVVKNARTGAWEYAALGAKGGLRPSGVRVEPDKAPPAGVRPHLMPSRDMEREKSFTENVLRKAESGQVSAFGTWNPKPVSGAQNLLIILVNFKDRLLVTTPSGWNTTTFDTTPGAKTLSNFYTDNSFGAVSLSPVIHSQSGSPAGIVAVSIDINHPNCGAYISYSVETAWLNAALVEAAKVVNFPSFDTNHDGTFQNSELIVYFVCAGYEAAGSSKTPNIWAHAWGGSGVTAGGIALRSWALNGELNDSHAQHPMGVIAHELGHSMCGLPDLYDTSYTNMGMDYYSVMAAGSWGKVLGEFSGTTPVSLDAWSRQYVGWSSPRTPPGGGAVSFGPALGSADAPVKLERPSVSGTQYFLIENRYSSGWDQGLEPWLGKNWGGGLLIQHIDVNVGTPGYNDINRYVSGGHQGVLVEQASTANGSLYGPNPQHTNITHLFYSTNNTAFTDATSPDSRLYDGTSTMLGITGVSSRGQTMTATIVTLPPVSAITSPSGGSTLHGEKTVITGTATDLSGSGMTRVDVSTDGGGSWGQADGTSPWSYTWYLPADGAYTVISRATDNTGKTETPVGPGIAVTVDNGGTPELQHYNWDQSAASSGCGMCHQDQGSFLARDYRSSGALCGSCHNPGGVAHEAQASGRNHPVMVNVSTGWTRKPAYGNVTASQNDNRPYAHLSGGKLIICATCHNPMNKYEDYGRTWEYTSTSDNRTYALERGGWSFMGRVVPRVYRDVSLWAGPTYSRDRKGYLVDGSEYLYDEQAGTITFNTMQQATEYVYVSLDYPYLRASSKANHLCTDCHAEATHKGANCLTCHQAHGAANLAGIRGAVRTTDLSERAVVFARRTGLNSFADGDGTHDGVCEVCHTTTKYYRRDGTGFAAHSSTKANYDGRDCAACHTHGSGFAGQ